MFGSVFFGIAFFIPGIIDYRILPGAWYNDKKTERRKPLTLFILRSVFIGGLLSLFCPLTGCKSLFYKEYRKKDYYEVTNGRHLFYDKSKMQEITVGTNKYKDPNKDTCTCIYRLEKASSKYCLSDLMIGFHLDIRIRSRDFYSGFPHDGSIERIKSMKFYLSGKNGLVDVTQYLVNETPLRDKIVFFSTDSIPTVPPADYTLYNRNPECYFQYKVRSIGDFIQKYNGKKFEDGLQTPDYYYFLFSVSDKCPYRIADYRSLITEITFTTGKHERFVDFKTPLDASTIPED